MIDRLPAYDVDDSGGDRFWVFTIALIRLPTLLGAINLEQCLAEGYDYELSRLHPDTGKRRVFVRSAETDIQTLAERHLSAKKMTLLYTRRCEPIPSR